MQTYPRPDRSRVRPSTEKTEENGYTLDIAWGEGQFSDGRPYRVEFWSQDQVSYLDYFFSTLGLETATSQDLKKLMTADNVVTFLSDRYNHVEGRRMLDDSGQEMWCVTLVLGDEDNLYLVDKAPVYRWPKDSTPGQQAESKRPDQQS